jgi:uncharacterized membrane protein YgcG
MIDFGRLCLQEEPLPYFVKGRGPAVLKYGPFGKYEEANAERDELELDPLYAGQEIYVEYVADVAPERRHAPLNTRRRKYRSRGRAGSRGGGRSSSSGGSSIGVGWRKKRRKKRRASRRR